MTDKETNELENVSENENYLEPSDFFDEMLKCLRQGKMSNTLGEMFHLLSERRMNRGDFVRYIHIREDLISLGVLACCKSFDKFEPYKRQLLMDDYGNYYLNKRKKPTKRKVVWNGSDIEYHHETCNSPYSFFTKCIYNAILQYLKKEYNQKNIKNKSRLLHGLEADYGYQEMIEQEGDDYKFDVSPDLMENAHPEDNEVENYY